MKIVAITRYFENVPESDTMIMDLDLCSSPEEMIFKKEIEANLGKECVDNPTQETQDILRGVNDSAFSKLNFTGGSNWGKAVQVNGTLQYGPTVYM